MVDLRITVIRSSGKNDTLKALFLHLLEDLPALCLDVFLVFEVLFGAGLNSLLGFFSRYTEIIEALCKVKRNIIEIIQRHERI